MRTLRHILFICCVFFWPVSGQAQVPQVRIALAKAPLEIAHLPVETYLLGVLSSEVPALWPPEVLKAQAVAARTYALYRKGHPQAAGYDLEADERDQGFLLSAGYPGSVRQAVKETLGEVLWWRGEVIPAFYHSCCGGHTEQAEAVWSWARDLPFYQGKADPYCRHCPNESWELEMDRNELTASLQRRQLVSGEVYHVIPLSRGENMRVREIGIITDAESRELSGNRFRQLIGFERLRSTNFNVLELGDHFLFIGSGYGHGVGLCQWGARGMAVEGKTYREILEFYYPGVEIKRVY